LEPKIEFPRSRAYSDCKSFLESFPINRIVLSKVAQQIAEFNKTYVLVKSFEQHAAKKVEALCGQASEALIIANPDFRDFHRTKNPQLLDLSQMVESYVIGALHDNLFGGLRTINVAEDESLYARILQIQSTATLQSLGVRKELECEMPEAINELTCMNTYITPLEKLLCIQHVNDFITKAVERNLSSADSSKDLAITTDDLIPLMLYVIIRAAPQYLHSNLAYMHYFTYSNISTTSLGFTLVTFRAAVEYVQSEHLGPLIDNDQLPRPVVIKQPSFAALNGMANNSSKENDNFENKELRKGIISPREVRNERKPLEKNSDKKKIERQANLKAPPEVIKLNQHDEQLGDFLSKLREETDMTSKLHSNFRQ